MDVGRILFLDLEVDEKGDVGAGKIVEFGAVLGGKEYRGASGDAFLEMAKGAEVICGHNILFHDLKYLRQSPRYAAITQLPAIDTLLLSVLLQPDQETHKLQKDYKLRPDSKNDPLADAMQCAELLQNLIPVHRNLAGPQQQILHALLHHQAGIAAFLSGIGGQGSRLDEQALASLIVDTYRDKICISADLPRMIANGPLELALALSILSGKRPELITPSWLLFQFPFVQRAYRRLRTQACSAPACDYCADVLNPNLNLKGFFRYNEFRRFDGDDAMPLQEKAVRAALDDKSFLVIFPTGGGKSLTFQLPALMRGRATNALTVVISPLLSLMKDQVDGLAKKDIHNAVSLNGLMSPLERQEAIERVENGQVNLLYIAPESLRSNVILNLLKGRIIDRFVIDEAHCFSAWGQDFRVDYLYIGPFIAGLQKDSQRPKPIPVSCFTATARKEVIEDIQAYFKDRLQLDLEVFQTAQGRTNLAFNAIDSVGEAAKMVRLVELLETHDCPTIVYVSRVKTSEKLAESLSKRGIAALAYNGKMEADEKKSVQEAFLDNRARVIVATAAFGMGVDKDNVGLVIHYEISNSLENYQQEAGRAGRDPRNQAECIVLFDEGDLDKHFELLNGTKLNQKEIAQIWKGIKDFNKDNISKSALEIAQKAGWDEDMRDLETRVKTAVNALEEVKYLARGQNSPRIFSNSILPKTLEAAKGIVSRHHAKFSSKQFEESDRVLQYLYGKTDGIAVDYMANAVGMHHTDLVTLLHLFREIGILGDDKDLTARIEPGRKENAKKRLQRMVGLEKQMLQRLIGKEGPTQVLVNLRELNSAIGIADAGIPEIRAVLRYWRIRDFLHCTRTQSDDFWYALSPGKAFGDLNAEFEKRAGLAEWVLEVLENIAKAEKNSNFKEGEFGFSVVGLKKRLEIENAFAGQHPVQAYEQILLYLHHIQAVELRGGLLVFYNRLNIERLQTDNRKQYTQTDYGRLKDHYQQKVEQVHIVGEYARRLLEDHQSARTFSEDYFRMKNPDFIQKYFPKKREELNRSLTPAKFEELFGQLTAEQLKVVKGGEGKDGSQKALVAAGPGSGKTRVLVHKMASLLLLEDVKPEQFLMLAFSRPAAQEFRQRLAKLVPGMGSHVEIYTYHGYAFRLIGRLGDLKEAGHVVEKATQAILDGEVPLEKIAAKSVIMLDEFQDVSKTEWDFLQAIIEKADNPRIIAAGDDDQSIYEFRGGSVAHMRDLKASGAEMHYLTTNFRSGSLLVAFANQYLATLPKGRIKEGQLLRADTSAQVGSLRIVRYGQGYLEMPLVQAVAQYGGQGTRAVLTATNRQALQITAQLRKAGVAATLLSSRDGFQAGKLEELVFVGQALARAVAPNAPIPPQQWPLLREALRKRFDRSQNLGFALHALDAFESERKRQYLLDWKEYCDQLRVEDIVFPDKQSVFVSTMHKAKGKEFDAVFLLLDKFDLEKDESKRAVYVAITRAKSFLEIHVNRPLFDEFDLPGLEMVHGLADRTAPDYFELELGMGDVVLDHFLNVSTILAIKKLQAGDSLLWNGGQSLMNDKSEQVLDFSKGFMEKLTKYQSQGFRPDRFTVDHIVEWQKVSNGEGKELPAVMVVLPRIGFQRLPPAK